jgi:predicted nucleic acid-binding Zn ribbon protein
MRRSKTISISEAVDDYFKVMKLDTKLKEIGIINSWESIVGKAIAMKTTNIYIKNRVLYVHLSSSVVRNELLMLREALCRKINEKAGVDLISEIILR